MNQFPAWVSKVQAIFLALGTFLTILAFQGLPVPSGISGFFTQANWDILIQTATSLFTLYQVVRAIFIATPSTGVHSLSVGDVRAFAFNPFKITNS